MRNKAKEGEISLLGSDHLEQGCIMERYNASLSRKALLQSYIKACRLCRILLSTPKYASVTPLHPP